MPWARAKKIELSDRQEKLLQEWFKGTHVPLHLKTRATIVLKSAQGMSNSAIAKDMGIEHNTVKKWHDRYMEAQVELATIESGSPLKLRSAMQSMLSDGQRTGGPPKFTDEQIAAILALACEDPSKFGLPFSHWTPALLQIEAIRLGIVGSISVRHIGRFLKREGFAAAPEPMLAESQHRGYRGIPGGSGKGM